MSGRKNGQGRQRRKGGGKGRGKSRKDGLRGREGSGKEDGERIGGNGEPEMEEDWMGTVEEEDWMR